MSVLSHVHVPWNHPHHPPSEKRLLDGVDLANPLLSGYMFKEAHSHLVFHKRFFVLFPRVLVYYEKESEYEKDVARGTLEVSICTLVQYTNRSNLPLQYPRTISLPMLSSIGISLHAWYLLVTCGEHTSANCSSACYYSVYILYHVPGHIVLCSPILCVVQNDITYIFGFWMTSTFYSIGTRLLDWRGCIWRNQRRNPKEPSSPSFSTLQTRPMRDSEWSWIGLICGLNI